MAEPGSADAVQQILRDRAERMRRDAEDAQALRERLAARRIERDRWGAGPARPAAAAGDGREDRHVGSAQIPNAILRLPTLQARALQLECACTCHGE